MTDINYAGYRYAGTACEGIVLWRGMQCQSIQNRIL